ncbi:protein FANTASTIC FOUR 3-like [Cynara cardunculus var. scolymus]|uniref:protein FANTASTIC FOUR 3-like n=1 Tax=Cynara cardunculus var. scolymus TaxID=59895 RepID=UPI000D62A58C|nr:protein FANTASTIC FOUR 3-like [Cynara cardunculus var. scolymus]
MALVQGLQSCLEPPRRPDSSLLTHKSSPRPPQLRQTPKPEPNSVIGNKNNGWSFSDILENPSSNHVKTEEVYVHPMVKRSASALSTKSLEMCTESLGTETGSDVSESSDEFSWEERERFGGLRRSKARIFGRKVESHRRGGGFPPPLTSISGSDGTVKVRPHREGGRLVIKAVSVSDCGTKFEAERTNGRLRLSLLKDCCVIVESGRAEMKNENGEEEVCGGGGDVEESGGGWWWETDGSKTNGGVRTAIRASNRPSKLPSSFEDSNEFGLTRCKDSGNGNKGIGNWSLLRVVIS